MIQAWVSLGYPGSSLSRALSSSLIPLKDVREEHMPTFGGQMVAQLVAIESWKGQDLDGVVRWWIWLLEAYKFSFENNKSKNITKKVNQGQRCSWKTERTREREQRTRERVTSWEEIERTREREGQSERSYGFWVLRTWVRKEERGAEDKKRYFGIKRGCMVEMRRLTMGWQPAVHLRFEN